ncbi:hypothetical protein OROMI_022609 [Orobanche minor]
MSNQNYNILLSCRHEEASNSERDLKCASHFYWEWQDLIRGRAPQTLPIRHPTGTENSISIWWDLNESFLSTYWKDGTEVDVTSQTDFALLSREVKSDFRVRSEYLSTVL